MWLSSFHNATDNTNCEILSLKIHIVNNNIIIIILPLNVATQEKMLMTLYIILNIMHEIEAVLQHKIQQSQQLQHDN